ncbi:unnamed protein product [Ectocarpus sp. CCAP 1310/34]|nr:unnamed protein product [Ectocarpus sp. CCAP 1310/34]
MAFDIDKLIRLEDGLKTLCEREKSPVSPVAKVNVLKYLQVQAVKQFQADYDDLHYELNKTEGLECLRSIDPVPSKELFQPKVLDQKDCGEDEQLYEQLQFYLTDAELAKPHLDELCADVKSWESTRRKATSVLDGDIRKVADMARVTVILATPEALAIMRLPKVSRSCKFDNNPQFWESCRRLHLRLLFASKLVLQATSENHNGLVVLVRYL